MKKLLNLFTALPLVAILMFGSLTFAGTGDIVVEGKYVEVPSNGMFYSASYFPDYNEADQGVVGDGRSTKDYIDTIAANNATLVFRHNSGSATTTYTFSTDETISSNINVIIEKGAILSIAAAQTLTINGSFDAGLYQVFSGDGSVVWGTAYKEVNVEWWGAKADDDIVCDTAFTKAYASFNNIGGRIRLGVGTYKTTASVTHNQNYVSLVGAGKEASHIKSYAVTNTLVITAQRFLVEDLSIKCNTVTAVGIYINNGKYGQIQNIELTGHTKAISANDTIQVGVYDNILIGVGHVDVGQIGIYLEKDVANSTTVNMHNNLITNFYYGLYVDDYGIAGLNTTGNIYSITHDSVHVGTNCFSVNFMGDYHESFDNKAYLIKSQWVSIINPLGCDYDDIDETGMAQSAFNSSVYLLGQYTGDAYDASTTKVYKEIGDIINYGNGIVSLKRQSRCRQYKNAEQTIPTAVEVVVLYEVSTYDTLEEFDDSITSGTATATTASHLIDSAATFTAADVGKRLYNTTDSTYAKVTAYNSATDLTIDADIMADTEAYKLYWSRFVATRAGYYLISATTYFKSATWGLLSINVDGAATAWHQNSDTADGSTYSITITDIQYLTAGQYVQIKLMQSSGVNKIIDDGLYKTYLSIHKLS